MSIVAKLGERTYEFESSEQVTHAREIYAHSTQDQNGFETEMEEAGIDFTYEM